MVDLEITHEKPAVKNILAAALRVISRAGIDDASMREIAAEAGVSKSLLHYHFRSKEHLLLELVGAMVDAIVARVAAVTRSALAGAEGDAHVLGASLGAIRRELVEAGRLPAMMLRLAALGTVDPAIRAEIAGLRRRVLELMAEGIRRSLGPERAALAPVDAAAELLLGVIVGLGAEMPFVDEKAPIEAAFALFEALLAQVSAGGTRR